MTSGRAIDHVVLAVRDLDAAASVYEGLGFRLTPRARHEDRMGTSNRLVQLAGGNFVELLEVDRPQLFQPHDLAGDPPFYSFGEHNWRAVRKRDGLSMLVFASDDAHADAERFRARGLNTAPVFDFERQATLPDGSRATLHFSLAFVWSDAMPGIGFFTCRNGAPQHFWKPQFQDQPNGARSIAAVHLASDRPERDAAFVAGLFDGAVRDVDGGYAVACGGAQEVMVIEPESAAALGAGTAFEGSALAGLTLDAPPRPATPAGQACGAFILWGSGQLSP